MQHTSIKDAYAQLIAAVQVVGNHPDCDEVFQRKLSEFESELHNCLWSLAQDNKNIPTYDQRAGLLNLLLEQAFA